MGQLVKDEMFTLFEAVGALEVCQFYKNERMKIRETDVHLA